MSEGCPKHYFEYRPNVPPEDRDPYKCIVCGEWRMDPPNHGQPPVPEDQLIEPERSRRPDA